MEYGQSHLAGQPYARCRDCGYTSVYWEDEDDLIHECEGDMKQQAPLVWTVLLAGDYATVTVTVEALTSEQAEDEARNLIEEYYGWDLSNFSAEPEVL